MRRMEKRRRKAAALRVIRDLLIGAAGSLIGTLLWKLIFGG